MVQRRKFYIDGAWQDPASNNALPVTNPATEEVMYEIALGSPQDVDKAVMAARRAFATFSLTTREQRIELLSQIIEVYKKRSKEIRSIEHAEKIAHDLRYAHNHDNGGDLIPGSGPGVGSVRNVYRSGDLKLTDSQGSGQGQIGQVQLPGFVAVTPGSGVIMMAPVSVCHQVSTIGQRPPPMTSWYHIHASGLMGSPTLPSRRSDERSCFATCSFPQRTKARIAVGAV